MTTSHPKLTGIYLAAMVIAAFATSNCATKQAGTDKQTNATVAASTSTQPQPTPEPQDPSVLEHIKSERWKGDLNGMAERRYIRALVTYNRSYYFYDGAEPRGITYEAMKEFETPTVLHQTAAGRTT